MALVTPHMSKLLVFQAALEAIAFYRTCHAKSHWVRNFVTFHFYAEIKYAPKDYVDLPTVNCSSWKNLLVNETFKTRKPLVF